MPSLKDLRNRISSIKATQKITQAMQMIAVARLKRAQAAAREAQFYVEKAEAILSTFLNEHAQQEILSPLLVGTGKEKAHLLVPFTAHRGLCGGFNSSIVRRVREHAFQLKEQGKDVKILAVGEKGYEQLKRYLGDHIIDVVRLRAIKRFDFEVVEPIGQRIIDLFLTENFDVVTAFYVPIQTGIGFKPIMRRLIPFYEPSAEKVSENDFLSKDYECESLPDFMRDFFCGGLCALVLKILLENSASEQGARMVAMDNATRNAGEMILKQTQIYNRSRQAMITRELIEIISGAEALKT